MKYIEKFFDTAIEKGASDLHLSAEERPAIRVFSNLEYLSDEQLDKKILTDEIMSLLSEDQKKEFEQKKELDFSLEFSGQRFRVNLHMQSRLVSLSARLVPTRIPSLDDLNFEPILHDFCNLINGLVLVVGATGQGKTTTIAAMIEEINKKRKSHIITIEDPIEFVFEDKESLIEQREIGVDTDSFAIALKHVLRQDPNVIMVGEMRDPETIAMALTAAETGHLVFYTLHTSTAAEAIERIVDVFEGAKQRQILIQLSAVLRGVVAQQLLPTVDDKLVSAREILVNTPAVANLIRENNISQIPSVIQTSMKAVMQTMDNSIKDFLKNKIISAEVAEKRLAKQIKI